MRAASIAAVACLLLVAARASADVDAGAMCRAVASKAETAMRIVKNIRDTIALFDRLDFSTRRSLVDSRALLEATPDDAAALRCAHGVLTGEALREAEDLETRVPAWAASTSARLAREEKARADVVLPICEAQWGAEAAQQTIARERANPSGVVDLRVLHDAGQALQNYRAQLAALRPLYRKARGREFRSWQDEPACVEEASEQQ